MPFERPSLQTLVDRDDNDLLSRLPGTDATKEQRVTRALAATQAGAVHELYGYLEWLSVQMFPQTCDDDQLHRHAAGVPRRQAAKATGHAVFTGTDGEVVPKAAKLQTDGVTYETTEAGTIASGDVSIAVAAVAPGAAGNQDASTELSMVSPLPGISGTATVDQNGLRGGVNIESYDDWRARIEQRRARTPRGGATGDWKAWALQVPGVTRAWEDPRGMGPGSVVVRIVADDAPTGPTPSQQLLDAVEDYIDERRNVEAHVYIAAPDLAPFAPTLRITPDTQDARDAVEQSLRELVMREAAPGGTLLISHIRDAISRAYTVEDYDLQSPTADVPHANHELATWGGVTWL